MAFRGKGGGKIFSTVEFRKKNKNGQKPVELQM